MTETVLLYALSTLAQTCAALAAFVGALGLYRLQILREHRQQGEDRLRSQVLSGFPIPVDARLDTMTDLLTRIEQVRQMGGTNRAVVRPVLEAHRGWVALDRSFHTSRNVLVVFEMWNLVVINGCLVSFTFASALTGTPWPSVGLWLAVVGTVGMTIFSVRTWTRA
jgi:hypothetical protein